MRKTYLIIMASALSLHLHAQTDAITATLHSIEQNNTTLKAMRHTADAQQQENRTALALDDPEIEYSYAWGGPASTPDKQNVSAKQSFDFGTLSGLKRKVVGEKNRLADLQYNTDRMDILLEAKLYCLDLVYYNALLHEHQTRLAHAEAIVEAQKERLNNGHANKLEYNNVMLSLSTLKNNIRETETERNTVIAQLTRLNGGIPTDFQQSDYPQVSLPADFRTWYAGIGDKNPELACVRQEMLLTHKELALSRTESLPTMSLGYVGEFLTGGERTQGVAVGMSLPLWSNKSRIRQAKAAVQAATERHKDTQEQWLHNLGILYQRTNGLKAIAEAYRASLAEFDNTTLLKTALDEGEISVLDYIDGTSTYYDTVDKALEAEHAYQRAYAELSAFEL